MKQSNFDTQSSSLPYGPRDLLPNERLKDRHVAMIALGGVIGAGLFIGSSAAIAEAGPILLASYVITGLLVVIVMRMLGEMLLANPGIGTLIDCIRLGHGKASGFTAGWLYWLFWVVTIGSESIGGAIAMQGWVSLPVWIIAPLLIVTVNLINLASVRAFGECEFWLSLIKVAAILIFCVLGILCLGHVIGPHPHVKENLLNHGGIAPFGWTAILSLIPTVLFSMIGTESATVAAAESEDAEESIARVTRAIGVRVTIFYLLSIALILCLVPWTRIEPGYSPFVTVMTYMGIPAAPTIMQIVVISAIFSCLNSSIYVASRTLRGLALKGDAPRMFSRVSAHSVPQRAVIFSSLVGMVVAFCSIISPHVLFAFLVGATGAVMLFIYGMVISAHRVVRSKDPQNKVFVLPLPGLLNWITLGALCLIVVTMFFHPVERQTLYASSMCIAGVVVAYAIVNRYRKWVAQR